MMQVYQGSSLARDARIAVNEALETIPVTVTPALVLAFFSTAQDGGQVAQALVERFGSIPIVGCSTAGEHLNGEHYNGALVVMALCSERLECAYEVIEGISQAGEQEVRRGVDRLFDGLRMDRARFRAQEYFALLLIDGLSMREEFICAQVAEALDGISLLGGSAGDDLRFESTCVLAGGRVYTDAAVVLLARAGEGVQVLKHQHFKVTPASLVITGADVAKRRVYEMDGYPAAQAYASVLGVRRDELTDEMSFMHPLIFQCQGQLYVRSVMKINEDDSIDFYCGIEEGMVLDVASHEDMVEVFEAALRGVKAQAIIGFNCILRALESKQRQEHDQIGQVLKRCAPHSIAFDTYGEQLNGLHINQTFVALALGVSTSQEV